MAETERKENEGPEWPLTTWEGARREELRRWSQMPLERIIAALEEMEDISLALHPFREPDDRAVSDGAVSNKS